MKWITGRIGSLDFQFEWVERLVSDHDPTRKLGTVDMQSCIIKIEKSVDQQVQLQTVLHEVTHVILSQTGQHDNIDPERVEDVINAISAGIFQFLRDNLWYLEDINDLGT
jgi:hypothetical protein